MKPVFISLSLLFLISACSDQRNQSSFFERGDGSAVSDSLLFMHYSERLGYHYSVRSDSVSWYIDEMLELSKRNNKQLDVLRLNGSKASEYMNAGEYAPAQEYYSQAFEMAQNPGIENHYWTLGNDATPEKRRLRLLSNLHFTYGHLMYLTENSEERLNQYRLANRIAVQNDDIINEAYTSDGLAMAYLEKNEPDSALIFINRSLGLSGQLPSQFYNSYASWIQGNIYMKLEAFDDAYGSYSSGMHSARNENNYQGLLINYLGLSRYFYKVNEPDSSLYYAYKTVGDGSVSDFQALRFDIGVAYENLHRVYKLRNEPLNALYFLELAKSARDSLNALRIQNLALFQQSLLNQQLELKEREREFERVRARNRVAGVLLLLLVMVIVAMILYRNYKLKLKANQMLDKTNKLLIDSMGMLTSAQDQLIQQEKLASLGQLTAGIAHEIKNPLNFVNNFSEVSEEMITELIEALEKGDIDESLELSKDIGSNLKKIHEHGSRADSIVKSMLMHSRGGNGNMEPTNLNELVKEYVNLSYHGMRAGKDPIEVDIDLQLDESIGEVPLIAEDFSRVILNLCNNAFDACAEGSLEIPPQSPGGSFESLPQSGSPRRVPPD
ncbi:MAG: sensor histidine kinase, partial [Cyclonatronaceae bacterium]